MASLVKRRRCALKSYVNVQQMKPGNCSLFLETSQTPDNRFSHKILVRNLDRKTPQEEVKSFFEKFGNVSEVLKSQKSQTTAFVTFSTHDEASNVCQASSEELVCNGKQLRVENMATGNFVQKLDDVNNQVKNELQTVHDMPNPEMCSCFDMLPNEILAHLFSFLDVRERIGIESVCRRWRNIGATIMWSHPTKLVLDPTQPESSKHNTSLTDKDLTTIFSRCGKNLKILTLAKYDGFTKKAVGLVGKYCPNLVELKLCRVSLSNACLKMLANGCPNLKSIGIHEASELRDDSLTEFLKLLPNLQCFDLSKVGSSTLKKGEFCWGLNKNLRIFRATECRFLYPPVAFAHVMSRCDALEEFCLNFAWRSFTSASGNVGYQPDEDLMIEFFYHFKDTMKVVHLYGIGYIKNIDWRPPICILYNLEELWLDKCYGVDTRFFKCLAEQCLKLRILNVSSGNLVTDAGLASLASLPCLNVLEVSCTQIDGSGLEVLAAHGTLEEVYARACIYLKEESCCILAKSCTNLRLLDVSGTKQISQTVVNTFVKCIEDGFLMSPVQLVVGGTSVVYSKDKHEGLEVTFSNTLNEGKGYGTLYNVYRT